MLGKADRWGRNFLGVPPQGRADYAFLEHILKSLDPKHRSLRDSSFRMASCSARRKAPCGGKLVEIDLLECVLGLGPNLFYNSPMEACVVVCDPEGRRSAGQGPLHRRRP